MSQLTGEFSFKESGQHILELHAQTFKAIQPVKAAAAAALFEKRLVIQKLIDRAQAKKMNLNGQKTHFYRLHAVLEATLQRLYNDMRRLEVLERKRLYAATTTTKKLSTSSSSSSHCKTLKKDFSFFLDSSSSSSSSSSYSLDSSSSSSLSEDDDDDDEILDVNPKQKNIDGDPLAVNVFFQRLKTAISIR